MTRRAGPIQAALLGTITAVGGGTIRDVLIGRLPSVLSSGSHAIPAFVAAGLVAGAHASGVFTLATIPIALAAAISCFLIRVVGMRYRLNAPKPIKSNKDLASRPPSRP